MTIIYIHGVKVRSPHHGAELGKPFRRWLDPKLSVNGAATDYDPVYWGDLGARFRWDLEARPTTFLLGQGGDEKFAGLGSLREAGTHSVLDDAAPSEPDDDAVLRPGTPAAPATTAAVTPPLAAVPRERRADFLADLYLAVHPRRTRGEDPIAENAQLAPLADAAAEVAAAWDALIAAEADEDARAARLVSAVDAALANDNLLAQGGFADWMGKAGETLRRATAWPADAVSTVFAELRPTVNEFVAYFIGDVLAYLNERENAGRPGEIPRRVLAALGRAAARKKQTGEKIVVVTHSMGGQLFYDAISYFAPTDPALAGLEVDHWITCGSQVSLFAEMRLFKGQPDVAKPQKLARPAAVKAWTNFYDRNDLVGFIMSPVFDGVTDLEYDTGYGLAFAHTGFLARPSFFQELADRL